MKITVYFSRERGIIPLMINMVDSKHVGKKLGEGSYGAAYETTTPDTVIKVSFYPEDGFRDYVDWLNREKVPGTASPAIYRAAATKAFKEHFKGLEDRFNRYSVVYVTEKLTEPEAVIGFDNMRPLGCIARSIATAVSVTEQLDRQFAEECEKWGIVNAEEAFDLLRALYAEHLNDDVSIFNMMLRKVEAGWELVIIDPTSQPRRK